VQLSRQDGGSFAWHALEGLRASDDMARVIDSWRPILEGASLRDVDVRLRRTDGLYRWHTLHLQAIRDEAGILCSDWRRHRYSSMQARLGDVRSQRAALQAPSREPGSALGMEHGDRRGPDNLAARSYLRLSCGTEGATLTNYGDGYLPTISRDSRLNWRSPSTTGTPSRSTTRSSRQMA